MPAITNRLRALILLSERQTMHLSRVLATTEGTEATLCTLYYALAFLHSQLTRVLEVSYERLAEDIVARASKTMMPGETLVAHIEPPYLALKDTCVAVKSAGDTINNVRYFLRLWGLVRIYESAKRAYVQPPRDAIVKLLVWSQLGAKVVYQVLENGAFLTNVGVLRTKRWLAREQKWCIWSNRAWMVFVSLEMLRLLRVRQLRFNEDFGAEHKVDGDDHAKTQSRELKRKWHRDFYTNAAWVAPTLHLSAYDATESPVSEAWMGLSGMIPGIFALQDVWRNTS